MRREWIGSATLFVVVALLVLRPWESDPDAGPASAMAVVTRVVDGDTVEARIAGEIEDVRLIGVDTPGASIGADLVLRSQVIDVYGRSTRPD